MFEEFINELKNKAESGNIEAQYQLGSAYHFGYKVARDFKQAIHWYSRAIEGGHVKALVNLGFLYIKETEDLIGFIEHYHSWETYRQKGIELWEKAAHAKDVKALYNLGIYYKNPSHRNETTRDSTVYDKLTREWFREAAEQGDGYSQGELGILLCKNDIDKNEGLHWLRLAASQDIDIYQYYLATTELSSGNIDEAILWYQKTNWSGAKYNLGLIHLLGLSTTGINHELAYKYLIEEEDVPLHEPDWGYQYYDFPHKFDIYKQKNEGNVDEITLFKKFCKQERLKNIYPNTRLDDINNDLLTCYLNESCIENTRAILDNHSFHGTHEKINSSEEKHELKDGLITLTQPELGQVKKLLSKQALTLKKHYLDMENINMSSFAGTTRVINSMEEYLYHILEKKYQYYTRTIASGNNPIYIQEDRKGILDFILPHGPSVALGHLEPSEFHVFEEEHIFIRVDDTRYYYYHNPKYSCDFSYQCKEDKRNRLPGGLYLEYNLWVEIQKGIYYNDNKLSSLQSRLLELFPVFGYKFIERKREEALKTKHIFHHQNDKLVVYYRRGSYCLIEEYSGNTSIAIYKIGLDNKTIDLDTIVENWQRRKIKSSLSLIDLIQMRYDSPEPDKNIKEASEEYQMVELQKKAKTGDVQAQYSLAKALQQAGCNVFGYSYSYVVESFKWYKKAALKGYPPAQHELGYCYSNGYGTKKNKRIATKWFKIAADNGYPWARRTFALYLLKGIGLQQNIPEAMKLLEELSMEGNRDAQSSLAWVYYNGVYVEENYELALKWHKIAAKQGEMYAQFRLGYTYENGHGVDINFKEATKWYKKAAKQGFAPAQYHLGMIFEKGLGVLPNKRKALQWYSLAAIQQDEISTWAREKVNELIQYFPKKTILLKLFQKMEEWNKKHNIISNERWTAIEHAIIHEDIISTYSVYSFYALLDELKKNGFTLN